jgi:hypothetical protein
VLVKTAAKSLSGIQWDVDQRSGRIYRLHFQDQKANWGPGLIAKADILINLS